MHFYRYPLDSLKSVFNVFRRKPSLGAPVVKREFLSKGFLVQQMTAGSKAFLF